MMRKHSRKQVRSNSMEFKLAQAEHLDALWRITEEAKAQLRRLGLDQWQRGYPSREDWVTDVAAGRIWMAVEGNEILGAFLFQSTPDPSYHEIDGAWLSDAPYAAIHRVCVSDASKGKGVAGQMFQKGFEMARALGRASVRIDTHAGNLPMQSALKKAGFRRCGVITLRGGCEDGNPRVAFEYIL
ncbi:MAG: GNAT family N-acetyltransferase [Ruminococcaceae bacterium]|nr:GNAT family N-acetyltransferase [Oscillospiraceae bacterium]